MALRHILIPLVGFTAVAPAQMAPGDVLSNLSLSFVSSPVPLAAEDLGGRGIVFFLFATENEASVPQAKVIGGRVAEWLGQGLVTVGLSGDADPALKAWLAAHPLPFPVARDGGRRLEREFGVRVLPAAVVLDARRRLVYAGHSGNIPPEALAAASATALRVDFLAFPAPLRPVREMLQRSQYARARRKMEDMLAKPDAKPEARAPGEALLSAIASLADHALDPLAALEEAKDYAAAARELDFVKSAFEGFPVAEEAAKRRQRYGADPLIRAEMDAGIALDAVIEGTVRKRRFREAVARFEQFAAKYPGSRAAAKALDMAARIRADGRYDMSPDCGECRRLNFACEPCKAAAREEARRAKQGRTP